MKKMIKLDERVIFVLKCLLFSYILTGGLLLLLALLLYRFQLGEQIVSVGIIIIYMLATMLAGFMTGKKMKSKKFIWGLFMGAIYFMVLILVTLLINHSLKEVSGNFITTLLICVGSGMLGGMIS